MRDHRLMIAGHLRLLTRLLRRLSLATLLLSGVASGQQALELARLPAYARADFSLSQMTPTRRTGRLLIALPGGDLLRLIPDPEARTVDGISTLRASDGDSRMLLTTDGTRAYGHIVAVGKVYIIDTIDKEMMIVDADRLGGPQPGAGGWMNDAIIDEEYTRQLLEEAERARAEQTTKTGSVAADATSSVVEVAVFIEGLVETQYGVQATRTRAQAHVAFTNEAFRINGIPLSLRLVYVGSLSETFPTDPNGDVFGQFARSTAVTQILQQYGADLRYLLYSQDARAGLRYCGQGYVIGHVAISGFECGQHAFAHEIGHNLGAHHDRANAGPIGHPIADYNYGYVCGGRGTIMSYVGQGRVDHYSSPNLTFGGQPCGVAIGQPDAAFNGTAMDVIRPTIEVARTPQATFGAVRFVQSSITVDEKGAPVPVTVERDGDLSRETSVEIALIDGTGTEGEDVRVLLQRVVFAAGVSSRTVSVEPLDDETFDAPTETMRAVLRFPLGLTVSGNPLEISLTGSDDPDRGKAQFSGTSRGVMENSRNVQVQVARVGASTESLTVSFVPVDETARNGVDYRLSPGQVTFAPGETQKAIGVEIIDDTLFQGYNAFRHFTVRLTGTNLADNRNFRLFVINDDLRRGKVQFNAADVSATENGGNAILTVQRIDGTEGDLRFNYATADGTARAGSDYAHRNGQFTLLNGATGVTLNVPLIDNGRFDGARTFTVTLTGDSLGTLATSTVTIVNDDPNRGLAAFDSATTTVSEKAGTLTLPVVRNQGSESTLTVGYRTVPGTARAGDDFAETTGSVTFAAGETTRSIAIPILDDDDVYDPGLAFAVELTGELVDAVNRTRVTIDNDDPNRGKAEFQATTASVSEAAGSLSVTVRRIEGSEGALVVNYATADGTARAGADFTAASGQITFAAGETSRTISVVIANNTVVDGSRTFALGLTGARLGTATSMNVTVQDDDRPSTSEIDEGGGGGGSLTLGILGTLLLALARRTRVLAGAPATTRDCLENHMTTHSLATFCIRIALLTLAPLITFAAPSSVATRPDLGVTPAGRAIVLPVLENDLGVTPDVCLTSVGGARHGKVVILANNKVRYTPARGFRGVDRFRYVVSTAGGRRATGHATVGVDQGSSLQLRGVVVDSPIRRALVEVELNDFSFVARSDDTGSYALDIASLSGLGFVIASATGLSDSGVAVDFRSVLGELPRLLAEAGADAILTPPENHQVNITNVSTAQFVLMQRDNGGRLPATDEELRQMARSVDPNALLEMAAVIRLIADEGVSLPDGVLSLLELISDPVQLVAFKASLAPGRLQATITALLAGGGDITPSFVAASLRSAYALVPASAVGTISTGNAGGGLLELDGVGTAVAGTGRLIETVPNATPSVSWQIDAAGELALTIDAPVETVEFPLDPACTQSSQREAYSAVIRIDARRLVDGDGFDVLRVTLTNRRRYVDTFGCPARPPEIIATAFTSVAVELDGARRAELPYANVAARIALPVYRPEIRPATVAHDPWGYEIYDFDAAPSSPTTWYVSAGRLFVNQPGARLTEYIRVQDDGTSGHGVVAIAQLGGGTRVSTFSQSVQIFGSPAFDGSNLAALWRSGFGISEFPGDTPIYAGFFIRLDADGTGRQEEVDATGVCIATRPALSWSVENNQMIARTMAVQRERRWTPLAFAGNRIYVLEEIEFIPIGGFNGIFDQRANFYEAGPVSACGVP